MFGSQGSVGEIHVTTELISVSVNTAVAEAPADRTSVDGPLKSGRDSYSREESPGKSRRRSTTIAFTGHNARNSRIAALSPRGVPANNR